MDVAKQKEILDLPLRVFVEPVFSRKVLYGIGVKLGDGSGFYDCFMKRRTTNLQRKMLLVYPDRNLTLEQFLSSGVTWEVLQKNLGQGSAELFLEMLRAFDLTLSGTEVAVSSQEIVAALATLK